MLNVENYPFRQTLMFLSSMHGHFFGNRIGRTLGGLSRLMTLIGGVEAQGTTIHRVTST